MLRFRTDSNKRGESGLCGGGHRLHKLFGVWLMGRGGVSELILGSGGTREVRRCAGNPGEE